MNVATTFSGNEVKNLVTKFYYRNNHLCFQILLDVDQDDFVAYNEYVDYSEYKQAYDELINMRTNNSTITLKQEEIQHSNVNLV